MTKFLQTLTALALGTLFTTAHASDPAQMAQGKALFTTAKPMACALCHTLKDAGAQGAIGPVLDELKPNAARVSQALKDGIGSMPSYKATMSDADIAALAAYVGKVTGAQ